MRIVLDTDVIVAAFRSDQGASRRLLVAALDREFVLLLSVPLVLEYEAVLKRTEHRSAIGLETSELDSVLDALVAVGEPIRLRFHWRPTLKDPSAEIVLQTAVNGRADRLASFNVKHLRKGARRFSLHVGPPGETWRAFQKGPYEKK